MAIVIKNEQQIEKMRVAGRLTMDVLEMIKPYVVKGVTTNELDQICHNYIVDVQKAIPAPLNYHGFPKSICPSIHHVICHGVHFILKTSSWFGFDKLPRSPGSVLVI